MSFGTVTVFSSEGVPIQEVPLDRPTIRIGRSPENEIQLQDERVSRRHADIVCSPRQVEIIDLSSANGVIVDGTRVSPLTPFTITDGSIIEIGRTKMRVALASHTFMPGSPRVTVTAPGNAPAPDEIAVVVPTPPQPQVSMEPPIKIELEPADLEIEAGESRFVTVHLTNRSARVEGVTLVVDGIPTSWVSLPDQINLDADGQDARNRAAPQVQITVPNSPTSRAGEYPCTVTARLKAQDVAQTGKMTVTVRPYVGFDADLLPRRARGGTEATCRLEVTNASNWDVPFSFELSDSDELLLFNVEADDRTVPAGAKRTFPLTIRPKTRRVFGPATNHAITGLISADVPEGVRGVEKRQKPIGTSLTLRPWPWWSLLVLFLPLLLIAAGLAIMYWPEPERITDTIRQGQVVQRVQVAGRVVPSDVIDLAFERDGVVQNVVASGAYVDAGAEIAFLRYYEQLRAVRIAEDNLDRARQELELARQQQARDIAEAKLDLAAAEEAARRVAPGGPDDPVRSAQQQLEQARRDAREISAQASGAKLDAEEGLTRSVQALQAAQTAHRRAQYELEYVLTNGTDPNFVPEWNREENSGGGEVGNTYTYPLPLSDFQIQGFRDRFAAAERALREAQLGVQAAERALEQARADEIAQVEAAQLAIADAQFQVIAAGGGPATANAVVPPQRSAADRAVEEAQLKLDALEQAVPLPQQRAYDEALDVLERERDKLERGTIIAPQAGFIIAASAHRGDTVQLGENVLQLAPIGKAEITFDPAAVAPLAAGSLQPGMPITVSLSDGTVITGTLKVPPATPDPTTGGDDLPRVELDPEDICTSRSRDATLRPEHVCVLRPGDIVTLTMTLQQSAPDALWVRPPFVISDGAKHKLVILERSPFWPWRQRERELFVRTGVQNLDQVEVIGFDSGDITEGIAIVGR